MHSNLKSYLVRKVDMLHLIRPFYKLDNLRGILYIPQCRCDGIQRFLIERTGRFDPVRYTQSAVVVAPRSGPQSMQLIRRPEDPLPTSPRVRRVLPPQRRIGIVAVFVIVIGTGLEYEPVRSEAVGELLAVPIDDVAIARDEARVEHVGSAVRREIGRRAVGDAVLAMMMMVVYIVSDVKTAARVAVGMTDAARGRDASEERQCVG